MQIAQLQEQVNRNSGNSSQPPSPAEPKGFKGKPKEKSGKKRGGQPGHEGHQRLLDAAEDCASIEDYYPDNCWQCGHGLQGEDPQSQ